MTKCPSCGDAFSSVSGMKSHHKHVHDESIAGVLVKCNYCDNSFRKTENKEQDKHFCDKDCFGSWFSENRSGEENSQYEKIKTNCKYCDKEIERQPHRIKRSDNQFCSQDCSAKWRSENIYGSNHPQWKEDSESIDYGKGWFRYRENIRSKFNNTCIMCKMTKEEFGQNLDVHHIIPVKKFENPKNAHFTENMVLLCRSCHRNIENLTTQEQLEELDLIETDYDTSKVLSRFEELDITQDGDYP